MTRCRCGWDGTGAHPCHGHGYTCRAPARARYYEPVRRYSIAGAQLKISAAQTYACDECWGVFRARAADERGGR